MKYLVIFLILTSSVVLVPQVFGSCILLPYDDSNINLDEPNYRFIDFSYAHTIGEPIQFILEKTTYNTCNSYYAEITDENENLVWGEGAFALCDPNDNSRLITSQIKIGYDEDNPIIINESGNYFIKIQIDDGSIQRDFIVRQNYTGASLDRMVYPTPWELSPLKQFNAGVPTFEIQCKQNLFLVQKYDGSPACVTEQTKQKLIERGWTTKDDSISKTSKDCMTIKQSKQIASFFKTPAYLPEGYSHVCSQSGTPFESYIVYYDQEFPTNWQIPELVSDGAIFIYQIDERNLVSEKKFQTYGSAEQRIQETYDDVMKNNPSLNPQLITINGMLAYAVDSCSDCGIQTANFSDGTMIQKSTSTETKIKFIDDNGVSYMLKTALPLQELIKIAESLQ